MKHVFTVLKVIFLIYTVLFCVFNAAQEVNVVIMPKLLERQLPLFLPILCGVIIGGLLILWIFMSEKFAAGREIKRLRKRLDESEKELERLHSITLTEEATKE
jgi:uncharacterized integral membrane protein